MTYIRLPFADSGDRTSIPFDSQPADTVSYEDGYTTLYALDPVTEPTALRIERELLNGLLYTTTSELQQYQQCGIPEFITTADNGGVPFPYGIRATVRYDDGGGVKLYVSLTDGNTALPSNPATWRDTSEFALLSDVVTSLNAGSGLSVDVTQGDVTATLNLAGLPTSGPVSGSTPVAVVDGGASSTVANSTLVAAVVDTAYVDALGVDAATLDGNLPSAFVASSREVQTLAQTGLSGGGDLTADRSLSVDIDNLLAATPVTDDSFAFDASGITRKATLTELKTAIGVQNLSDNTFTGALNVTGALTSDVNINADTLDGAALGTSAGSVILGGDFTEANAIGDFENSAFTVSSALATASTIALRDASGNLVGDKLFADNPADLGVATPDSVYVTDGLTGEIQVQDFTDFANNLPLSGFVPTSRTISTAANSGLAGGGDLTANRSLSMDIANLLTATPVVGDTFAFDDSGTTRKATLTELKNVLTVQNLSNNTFSGALNVTGAITSSVDINADTLDSRSLGTSSTSIVLAQDFTEANSIGDFENSAFIEARVSAILGEDKIVLRDSLGVVFAENFNARSISASVNTQPSVIVRGDAGGIDASFSQQSWQTLSGNMHNTLGGPFLRYRFTGFDRNNTTTVSADPLLTYPVQDGSDQYAVEIYLVVEAGAGGFRWKCGEIGSFTGTAVVFNMTSGSVFPILDPTIGNDKIVSFVGDYVIMATGQVFAGNGTTLAVEWAQATSNAEFTRVAQGSWIKIQRRSAY